ncbi:MAG TPA: pyruvate dehydrogenase (acetyl-transferring) E1 component subunit alpha [Ilumatobacter sp.]
MSRLDTATRTALLRDMVFVRRFEERCAQLYQETKIRGFLHLYVGEEAIAAGVCHLLRADDGIVATYREHGHALMKGVSAEAVMAEMFGRVDGCSGGRGGSMHLFDAEHRLYGGNAIVGGGLPLAVGLGLAEQMNDTDRVIACFFGEGAMAEGEFHESMNLAALWDLPVLFCCENNRYAMGTALERSEAETDLAMRAAGYGMPSRAVDGMDVEAVVAATGEALSAIRSGAGPVFLEFRTYRFRAHSMYDPELYRDKGEVAEWRQHGPIRLLFDRMLADGEIDPDAMAAIETAADAEIERSVEFADASPWEDVATLERHVYAPDREEVPA